MSSENGATLIAITIGGALWGVNCAQCCFYFSTFPEDRKYLKILVAGVLVSDLLHQIMVSLWTYTSLIANFGNAAGAKATSWTILASAIFNVRFPCLCSFSLS
ncbi:hypothetical protein FIBSPDRAFT_1055891 [Athelia psychrophila]|uniref:Uncharacterized protein n=1 Tax=Athelia psychrophila TaxID=1759441 RepID=A0A167SZS4_9AGAM|nr:hypothetical protein FIBSPDRAFT_1055891 [Fibularhizoctonia sp. CBS 109695]